MLIHFFLFLQKKIINKIKNKLYCSIMMQNCPVPWSRVAVQGLLTSHLRNFCYVSPHNPHPHKYLFLLCHALPTIFAPQFPAPAPLLPSLFPCASLSLSAPPAFTSYGTKHAPAGPLNGCLGVGAHGGPHIPEVP
jgi:hypothetical protein